MTTITADGPRAQDNQRKTAEIRARTMPMFTIRDEDDFSSVDPERDEDAEEIAPAVALLYIEGDDPHDHGPHEFITAAGAADLYGFENEAEFIAWCDDHGGIVIVVCGGEWLVRWLDIEAAVELARICEGCERAEHAELLERSKKEESISVVYFLQAEDSRLIKIGTSTKLGDRIQTLRAENASRLELLATMPGTARHERECHKLFAEHRRQGEWFEPAPELLAFIDRVRWGEK